MFVFFLFRFSFVFVNVFGVSAYFRCSRILKLKLNVLSDAQHNFHQNVCDAMCHSTIDYYKHIFNFYDFIFAQTNKFRIKNKKKK